ncbi:hypothetical protein PMI34_02036 [Pseudomonas sp. GM74]|nr:hypothetical protein PMI34_02036 [Pseudomonas sp. GM74]
MVEGKPSTGFWLIFALPFQQGEYHPSKPAPTGIFSGQGTQCGSENIRKIALQCLQSGHLPEITDSGVQSRSYTLC